MARRTFATAVKAGGAEALGAIRDELVADLGRCESMRDRAALFLRLVDVVCRLDSMAAAAAPRGDSVDQLRLRRAKRVGPAGTTPRTQLLGD